jgi:hypothetical protein
MPVLDPKEERFMVALKAAVMGTGTPFKFAARTRLVGQSIPTALRPACGIHRVLDREDEKNLSPSSSKANIVVALEIHGSVAAKSGLDDDQLDAVDTELITLKSWLKDTLIASNLGGVCAPLEYRGADTALMLGVPQGMEMVAFKTTVVTNKTDSRSA